MKYKGIELKEFTSDKPVSFDPPMKMLMWDKSDYLIHKEDVYAFLPTWDFPVVTAHQTFMHCAEIPEAMKSRRATNRELAKWLAQGNGMTKTSGGSCVFSDLDYLTTCNMDDACSNELVVRKWDDKEWHEPTPDYMGLDG